MFDLPLPGTPVHTAEKGVVVSSHSDRAGELLGRVAAVDDHGAHGLLRIEPPSGAAFLVPFVDAYVDRVDLAARCIDVDWQADY